MTSLDFDFIHIDLKPFKNLFWVKTNPFRLNFISLHYLHSIYFFYLKEQIYTQN